MPFRHCAGHPLRAKSCSSAEAVSSPLLADNTPRYRRTRKIGLLGIQPFVERRKLSGFTTGLSSCPNAGTPANGPTVPATAPTAMALLKERRLVFVIKKYKDRKS